MPHRKLQLILNDFGDNSKVKHIDSTISSDIYTLKVLKIEEGKRNTKN